MARKLEAAKQVVLGRAEAITAAMRAGAAVALAAQVVAVVAVRAGALVARPSACFWLSRR